MKRRIIGLAAFYCVGALVTFGHSAAESRRASVQNYEECRIDPKAYCPSPEADLSGAIGLIAALLWPLYWSWELQE